MAAPSAFPKSPRFTEFQDHAPEVAPSNAPVAVPKDAEGLQYLGGQSSEHVSQGQESAHWSEKQAGAQIAGPKKRREWLWVLLGIVLVCLAIGLGAGLGIGLHRKNNSTVSQAGDGSTAQSAGLGSSTTSASASSATSSVTGAPSSSAAPEQSSTAAASSTASTSTVSSATSSTTQAVATSGTTGIAAFSCNASIPDNTYTTTSNPTKFTEECYVDYPVNEPGYGNAAFQVADLAKYTVYSFQSCMEQCALYNYEQGSEECHAVSYSARLSPNVEEYGGNCWIKDGRGVAFSSAPDEDYSLIASAYITNNDGVSV